MRSMIKNVLNIMIIIINFNHKIKIISCQTRQEVGNNFKTSGH